MLALFCRNGSTARGAFALDHFAGAEMTADEDRVRRMRAAPRTKLFQPTEMTAGAEAKRAHLLDVSTGGAQVHAAEPPPLGSTVRIMCGGDARLGRVVWRHGRRFGAVFLTPLSDAQVSALLDEQRRVIEEASRRIGVIA